MRKGFWLLELIFAIVVMAIAMLSIPTVLSQTTAGIETTLKQEAIFYGSRTMGSLLTYRWDENSIKGDPDKNISHILDVSNGDSHFDRNTSITPSRFRTGNFNLKAVRTFFNTTTNATSTLGNESGESEKDDIDDFNNDTDIITAQKGDFVLNMKIHKKIYYIADTPTYSNGRVRFSFSSTSASPTTNVKMIELNVTDDKDNTILLIRTITCNVGEPTPQTVHKG